MATDFSTRIRRHRERIDAGNEARRLGERAFYETGAVPVNPFEAGSVEWEAFADGVATALVREDIQESWL